MLQFSQMFYAEDDLAIVNGIIIHQCLSFWRTEDMTSL
jgi:hypothetical protein